MIISERELLFQQGHFDAQIAESERAARERFREREHAAFLASKGHSSRLRDHIAKRDAQTTKAAQPAASPKPVAKVVKAATAPVPKPMSAAERAAADAERQRRLVAEESRRKEVQRQAELKRQADIRDSWAKAHSRVADPFGRNEPEDPKGNHGWAKIHAEIRAQRGN